MNHILFIADLVWFPKKILQNLMRWIWNGSMFSLTQAKHLFSVLLSWNTNILDSLFAFTFGLVYLVIADYNCMLNPQKKLIGIHLKGGFLLGNNNNTALMNKIFYDWTDQTQHLPNIDNRFLHISSYLMSFWMILYLMWSIAHNKCSYKIHIFTFQVT